MTAGDSGLERERLAAARDLLHARPPRRERAWPALAAAAFAAFCALVLAASMLIGPTFNRSEPTFQEELR
jgi:ferric-dicitrate binding protein FerR (iron transport regulator)